MLEIFLWVLVAVAGLIGLDRLFLWMEAKGWVYYRKVKRKGSAAGGILTGVDVFDPGTRYLDEARHEHVLEEEDDGDDDDKRKKEDQVS